MACLCKLIFHQAFNLQAMIFNFISGFQCHIMTIFISLIIMKKGNKMELKI